VIGRAPKYTGPERRQRPRWRPQPWRVLANLLFISFIGYGLAVMWLIGRETQLVFQAGSTLATGRPPFPYEQIDVPRSDGLRQFAWVMRTGDSDAGPWVLYLHGSASSVASQVNIAHYRVLRNAGLNVMAPEYRGFGGVAGSPTENGLQTDASAAYDYLRNTRRVKPQSIVIYGWSLGAAVAVDMASRTPPAALMLEGAPASLVDLTGRRYPFFPLRLFMRSSFDSIRKIGSIPAPVLFLHSVEDELIPISEGRRLHQAARGAKMFVELHGGHLAAIDRSADVLEQAVRTFLQTYGPGRGASGP
jgi:dipeptidyl aminopeptidase/acylaminoacyl peptidase